VSRLTDARVRDADAVQFVPPGHFYSPYPSISEVRANEARLYPPPPRKLPGLELRESEQLALLDDLRSYYDEQPFPETRTPPRRYWFENPMFGYSDAIFLHAMIRYARPRRIVEVGSGYSSAVMLDTNELFFGNAIDCTFIEPYPDALRQLLRDGDESRVNIIAQPVQSVDFRASADLEANDILFIDSSHVSKVGSDVNHLMFEVLPRVRVGVYVHFHDVVYPFEYPPGWVYEGRAWSEAYLLRSFLAFNESFEIVLHPSFLVTFHHALFADRFPLCLKNTGGSIWLRRRA
jgi:predicted O-methyltransferase YrrM